MKLILFILIIIILIAVIYIVQLKKSFKKIRKDLINRKDLDTNSLITTISRDRDVCDLILEINNALTLLHKKSIMIDHQNKALKQMITNISHDLRTPLTSALGYVELIENENLSKEEEKKILDIVEERLKKLSTLINDFFTFTKIITYEEDIELQMLNINEALIDCFSLYYNDFKERGWEVHFDISEENIMMYSNSKILEHIFSNLIQNALKHGDGDFYVTLKQKQKIELSFSNKTTDKLLDVDNMFEKFYTSDISRTNQNTGLGLAIVKEFSEILNGEVSAILEKEVLTINLKF